MNVRLVQEPGATPDSEVCAVPRHEARVSTRASTRGIGYVLVQQSEGSADKAPHFMARLLCAG